MNTIYFKVLINIRKKGKYGGATFKETTNLIFGLFLVAVA